MNERIKALLLNERNMFVNGVTESDNKIYIHGSEENLEKFAELIVQECINICAERELDIRTRIKDEGKAATAYMIRAYIKEHFGVKE